jgi:Holliday junction resolvasome RuvABC endonuclease subunit
MRPWSVLGVDLSYTSTGLAHIHGDPSDRTLWTIGTKPDHAGLLIGRAAYIGDQIRDEANARMVDTIAIEGPSFNSRQGQMFNQGMLHGIVRYLLDEGNLEIQLLPPSVWRKVIFGKGNVVDKEKTRLRMFQKYGFGEEISVDALEAFAVAHTAWLLEQTDLPKYQEKALREWKFPKVKKTRKKEAV